MLRATSTTVGKVVDPFSRKPDPSVFRTAGLFAFICVHLRLKFLALLRAFPASRAGDHLRQPVLDGATSSRQNETCRTRSISCLGVAIPDFDFSWQARITQISAPIRYNPT
jgi:hypothetical protein